MYLIKVTNSGSLTVSRVEPLYLTVMHIRYDRSLDDCLAVRVCPFDDEAHYVEILLLGYYADGHRCWLDDSVRRKARRARVRHPNVVFIL